MRLQSVVKFIFTLKYSVFMISERNDKNIDKAQEAMLTRIDIMIVCQPKARY